MVADLKTELSDGSSMVFDIQLASLRTVIPVSRCLTRILLLLGNLTVLRTTAPEEHVKLLHINPIPSSCVVVKSNFKQVFTNICPAKSI